jgi:thiol-disulfide isomerase/thioredoxin
MKKIIVLFTLFSLNVWSQEYNFLSKNYVEITKIKFQEFRNNNKDLIFESFLENGKIVTKRDIDSIVEKKVYHEFKQRFFRDSINNKFASVLRKMTKEELKEQSELGKKQFNDEIKKRKDLKGLLVDSLSLVDLEGNRYTMQNLKGKVIVLNFWFTKCAPCIKEIPDLNKIKKTFGTENVAYFAITYDNKEIVDTFLEKIKIDFTVIPNDRKTIDQFKTQYFPTNLILDQKGEVVFVSDFFMRNMIEDMNKTIKKLLKM